jgi:hypothetical protein
VKRTIRLTFWPVCLLLSANAFADAQNITLPIGTEISIRTIDRIDSKKSELGKEYPASLDDPILVDGMPVVAANTNAFVRIVEKSRGSLSLALSAVTINGQRVAVSTDKLDSRRGSTVKRTAIGAGAGAGTGAAIGAIAGGGAGAGIGAAAGAAAGGILGHLTAKPIEIAPETRFTYRLTQAAVIQLPPPAQTAQPQSTNGVPAIQPPPPPQD